MLQHFERNRQSHFTDWEIQLFLETTFGMCMPGMPVASTDYGQSWNTNYAGYYVDTNTKFQQHIKMGSGNIAFICHRLPGLSCPGR